MKEQSSPESYAEALAELEELLDELEGADVDVDLLAERVARGVELIRFCRGRLEVVTQDVDGVVAELIALEGEARPVSGSESESESDSDSDSEHETSL